MSDSRALAAALAANISAGDARMYAWLTEGGAQPLPLMQNAAFARGRADSLSAPPHAFSPLPVTTTDMPGGPMSPFAEILMQGAPITSLPPPGGIALSSPIPDATAPLLVPAFPSSMRSPGDAPPGDRSLSATLAGFRAGANAAFSKLVATFSMPSSNGAVPASGVTLQPTTNRSLSFSSLDDAPATTPAVPLVAPTAHVATAAPVIAPTAHVATTTARGRKRGGQDALGIRRNAGSSNHLASLLEATGFPFATPQEAVAAPQPRKRARGGAAANAPVRSSASSSSSGGASASEVQRLREENAELREHVRMLTSGEAMPPGSMMPQQEATRQAQLQQLMALAQSRAPDAQLRKAIFEYKDLHADFGHDRWAALRYHLRSLKQLLVPNQITRMCMWSLTDGPASGSTAAASGKSTRGHVHNSTASSSAAESADAIWNSLVQHCEMTPEQLVRMTTLREGISERRKELLDVLNMLRSLEDQVAGSFRGLEFQMNLLMSHLSPRQIALFLEWMELNQTVVSSMSTVNAWPKPPMSPATATVTSAPVRSGKRPRDAADHGAAQQAPPESLPSEEDDGDFDSYPFPVKGNGTLFNMSFPGPSDLFAAISKLRPGAAPPPPGLPLT